MKTYLTILAIVTLSFLLGVLSVRRTGTFKTPVWSSDNACLVEK